MMVFFPPWDLLNPRNVSGLSTKTLAARSCVLSARKRTQSFGLSVSAVPLDHNDDNDYDYDGNVDDEDYGDDAVSAGGLLSVVQMLHLPQCLYD